MTDAQHWKVLDQVLRLEVVKGHLRWSISDLARHSGVGRTLIYYYFGKSKADIVGAAMKIIGDEFFGLSPERLKVWAAGDFRSAIIKTRELMEHAPHIKEFYFHWRHQPSEVRDHLVSLEKRYLQKLRSMHPHLGPAEAQALWAMVFGMALVPDLKEEALALLLKRAF